MIKTSEMRKLYSDIVEFAFVAVSHCQREPTYVPDHAVVPPLFSVIQNCEGDAIRKRAYGLLSSVNRQEGLLNSRLTARVAERYIRLIESDRSTKPPPGGNRAGAHCASRPLTVNVSIHEEDKQAVVGYNTERCCGIRESCLVVSVAIQVNACPGLNFYFLIRDFDMHALTSHRKRLL